MKIRRKIALVTGASSGIGQATAERLAKAGYKVSGTSRRAAPTGQRSFEMLPLDVTKEESLDHELRTMGIRVSVVEPAYINTPFDANLIKPDAPIDVYREIRAGVERRVKEALVGADGPEVVAEVVLKAAVATHPKIHYTPGLARRMRLLRRFAPANVLDAGVRKDLQLEASLVTRSSNH
jgi:NAD(P)-dependent dehydrogenase (short-subunit alcohol dehydrogenase family)